MRPVGLTFLEKDNYGNEVSRLARPLPVEYMLVDVPASTPLRPQYTFTNVANIRPFPVENRFLDGFVQDLVALSAYLAQFEPHQFLSAASDFHFLLYIATMEILPMKGVMAPLLAAVRNKDENAALEWSQSEQWATVEHLVAASAGSAGRTSWSWPCGHCTFWNSGSGSHCSMCNLPR